MHPRTFFRWALGLAAVGVAAVGLFLAGRPTPPAAHAADPAPPPVAQYGGSPQRNMVNLTEKGVPDGWDVKEGKNIKWKANLGSRSYGGPTVSGGKVFIGTNNGSPRDPAIKGDKGVLMCFDEKTGSFLWQAVHDKLPSGQVNDWPNEGICSSPAVEGDRIYYVSNRCEVVCATTDGQKPGTENVGFAGEKYKGPGHADIVWTFDMIKELNVFPHNMAAGSPLIVGDALFVTTANGVDEGHINIPAPDAPSFLALSKKTGKLLWSSNLPGKNIMHGQWSNPSWGLIGGKPQVFFPGGDGWLYAFEPDTGALIWKFDCNPKKAPKYELGGKGIRSDFIATPVVADGKVFIGVGQDPEHYEGVGYLYCIDPAGKTGDVSPELVTKEDPDPTKRETKPNPNSAQVWVYGGPNKDPDANRDYVFGRTMSTVSIHDGLLYAGELAGYVHCLDVRTGKPFWTHDLKSALWGSTYWVDGKVYVATEDGDVWVFKHGKEKAEPVKIEMDEPVRSTPTVVGKTLFVLGEKTLFAIADKK
jgi:outer membrane protein assembly factor BamB